MSPLSCAREHDVKAAALGGRWSEDLRAHAAECRHCGDVALVASALALPMPPAHASVNPGRIWMRARFERRQRAEALVSRLLTGAQVVAGSLVAGVLVAVARRMEWWGGTSDATVPVSLVAAVGLLMLAGVAAASLASKET